MKLKSRKIISMALVFFMMLTILPTTAFAASDYYNKLGATNASVTLDGTNDGEVTVSLVGTADMDVYAIQGDWDTKETEGTNKLKLDKITTDVTNVVFTGMNYADAPTGKVLWTDDTFSAPAKVANGTKLLNATYKVAADTPSGTYTVRFKFITLTATDYNSYTDEVYYTAKITVTNNGGGGSTGSYYDKLEATNASVALDGTNDGEVTVSLVGNSDMDVYAIQGDWDTKETEGTNKLKLDKITTDVTNVVFTGMNYADAPTGKVLWTDDTFSAPAKVANGTKLLNATYKVAADTPAGTYTVRFKFITLTATDYNSYTDEVYYTAKITVTRPAAHVCSNGTKQAGQDATCTVDGWNDYYKCSGCDKLYEDAACTTLIPDLAAWKTGDGKIVASHEYGTLVEEVPAKHTATELEAGMKAHYFCDVCDTYFTEEKAETTLEALTGETPAHSYGAWVNTDPEKHWKACSCGLKTSEGVHVYDDANDTTCNDCGYVRTLAHEHEFEAKWTYDETNHWHAATCGHDVKSGEEAHHGGTATCKAQAVCVDCGQSYGSLAAHTYGELIAAQTEVHTQTKLKAAVAAHYFCDVCDTYFTEAKVETTLEALTGETPAHSYGAWVNTDKTNHWKECSCGLKADKATHSYGDDRVCDICNYKKPSSGSSSGGGFSGSYNYPVIVGDTDGADVAVSDEHATKGEKITITVKPDAGKQVDEVIVTDADGDEIAVTKTGDNEYTFTMPASKVTVDVATEAADYGLRIVMQINNKNILVNGSTITNDVAPVIVGDRTLVPIRVVTELLGGSADWDNDTRTVTLKIDGKTMNMTIGKPIPGFGTSAVIMNDRTYVPVRYVMEKLGAEVEWIGATRQIIIEK